MRPIINELYPHKWLVTSKYICLGAILYNEMYYTWLHQSQMSKRKFIEPVVVRSFQYSRTAAAHLRIWHQIFLEWGTKRTRTINPTQTDGNNDLSN